MTLEQQLTEIAAAGFEISLTSQRPDRDMKWSCTITKTNFESVPDVQKVEDTKEDVFSALNSLVSMYANAARYTAFGETPAVAIQQAKTKMEG